MAIPIIMIAHRGINIHTNNADDDNEKLRKSSMLIYYLYINKLSLLYNLFDIIERNQGSREENFSK